MKKFSENQRSIILIIITILITMTILCEFFYIMSLRKNIEILEKTCNIENSNTDIKWKIPNFKDIILDK